MTLTERMRDYLARQDDWLAMPVLSKLARQHNYNSTHIDRAIRELHEAVDIGIIQVSYGDTSAKLPPGTYIRLYPMTEEEKKQRREVLEYFDSL